MNKEEYFKLYKHPKWQRKRLEILDRDNFKCLLCSNTEDELHVHHTFYVWDSPPWDYLDKDLETYCTQCHDKTHSMLKVPVYKTYPSKSHRNPMVVVGDELCCDECKYYDDNWIVPGTCFLNPKEPKAKGETCGWKFCEDTNEDDSYSDATFHRIKFLYETISEHYGYCAISEWDKVSTLGEDHVSAESLDWLYQQLHPNGYR